MKNMKIYNKVILPVCFAVVALFSSCSAFDDFLTVYPTNQITGEQFWEDKNDLLNVVGSCYVQLKSMPVAKRMFVWGELRSDNLLLTSESNTDFKNIMNANLLPTNGWFDWASFYKGIGYCNLCLQKGPEVVKKDASFQENDWKPVEAELKALRALYYFYLVRAFRDVPFVIEANDTSEGATNPVPQTASETILTYLINDLEAVKDNGMKNFGNDEFNKGRFGKRGIYALLCDMYLWRASKNSSADSLAKYPGEAEADYRKVIEYADFLSQDMLVDFKGGNGSTSRALYYGHERSPFPNEDPLPLYVNDKSKRVTDKAYSQIFGYCFSLEDIFEVCDGTGVFSSTEGSLKSTYFGSYSGNFNAGMFSAAAPFQNISSKPDDKNNIFSKTDLRYYETIMKPSGSTVNAVYNISKFVARSVSIDGCDDITKTSSTVTYNWGTNEDNFKVYRMTDILLMKAEAIACLQQYILKTDDETMLKEGFRVAKAVFARSNPMIDQADDLVFENYSSGQTLEDFVMRERQRELFGEGKRWFDLVRYALRQGNTQKMLGLLVAKYSTNASAIKAKLATINSLYNPVYKEEMKVNTALVQNPAWVTDETIEKN